MELLIWLLMGLICYELAKGKNRDTFGWTVCGLLFGIFAVLVLLILPRKGVK